MTFERLMAIRGALYALFPMAVVVTGLTLAGCTSNCNVDHVVTHTGVLKMVGQDIRGANSVVLDLDFEDGTNVKMPTKDAHKWTLNVGTKYTVTYDHNYILAIEEHEAHVKSVYDRITGQEKKVIEPVHREDQ